MTRRTLGRPRAALLLALFLCVFHMEASLASPAHVTGSGLAIAADSDGDGIPDDMDPDDDNDGLPDSDQGGDGVSPGNDPLPDSDNDGITDDMDPDDNNNAVTDDDEPVPSPSGGGSTGGGNSSGSSGTSSGDQPLVRALPVTGSGPSSPAHASHIAFAMAISAVLLALTARWQLAGSRAPHLSEDRPIHQ